MKTQTLYLILIPIILLSLLIPKTTKSQGDSCTNAVAVTPGLYSADGPSSGNGAANICESGATHSDWYAFTPTQSGTIDIQSCYGGSDTRLSLYDGSCGALNCIAMADDECDMDGSGDSYASELIGIPVTGGTTYYIEWDDYWEDSGFDWTLSFTSCPAPENLITTNISTTSADLAWTQYSSASLWNIEWGETGFILGEGTLVTGITTSNWSLSGLTDNTTYDWYVQADCGDGSRELSTWSGPATFSTLCYALSTPYDDSFETQTPNTSAIWSDCWVTSPANTSELYRWNIDGSGSTPSLGTGPDNGANIGANYAYAEASGYEPGDSALLYSAKIDISGLSSPAFSFYYHMYGATIGTLHVDVHDGADWNNNEISISGEQQSSGSDPWQLAYLNLNDYSDSIQFRFRAERGTSYTSDICIDDISIDEAPSCPPSSNLGEENISGTSADLGWTENGNATTWNIEWGPSGFTPGSGTFEAGVTSNPYTLSGLTGLTTYDWHVQADCGPDSREISDWSYMSTFTTPCGVYPTIFNENFSSALTPSCWSNDDAEQWKFGTDAAYGAAAAGDHTPGGGTNYAWIDGSYDIQSNALITPFVDVSGLIYPVVEFYFFSNNTNIQGDNNTLTVDFWDGDDWNLLLSYAGDDPDWQHCYFDLSTYTITGPIQLRFVVTGTANSTYYNDILVDDITITKLKCNDPTDLLANNIYFSGADLTWSGIETEISWNVEWGFPGFLPGTGNELGSEVVYENLYKLNGLSPDTEYDWYVQAECGEGIGQSDWAGPGNFTTASPPAEVQSYPFSEGWESGTIGGAWDTYTGSVAYIQVTEDAAYDGSYGLKQYGNPYNGYYAPSGLIDAYNKALEGGVNENWTSWGRFSVDLTDASQPYLSFWYAMGYWHNNNFNNFWVQASTDGGNWTDLFSTQPNGEAIAYENREINLVDYLGTDQLFLRFFHNGRSNYLPLNLDSIEVKEITCPRPIELLSDSITTSSVELFWTENGTAASWNIEWGESGFTQGEGTMITGITENPYSLTGLEGSTYYDWYIQADCDPLLREISPWSGPELFHTACTVQMVPFFEHFDFVLYPAFPVCMTIENVEEASVTWETSQDGLSAPNSAYIEWNSFMEKDDWFFTNGLDLTSGVTYVVDFVYKSEWDEYEYTEKLAVDWGTSDTSTSMSGTPIFDDQDFNFEFWEMGSGEFTPTESGTYYVGFHAYSIANQYVIFIDDISIVEKVNSTTWTGSDNTNWRNSANWDNGLPSSATNVTIPAGKPNYPVLTHASGVNNLLIESGPDGDGAIIGNKFLFVNGEATVQRYITGAQWHDIGAPVKDQKAGDFYQGGDPDVWLRRYLEPTNERQYISSGNQPLNPGEGFEVWVEAGPRYDITIDFKGPLTRSDLILNAASTPALSFTTGQPQTDFGYNLISNPFASPLDWDEGTWNLSNVSSTIWVWDPMAGNWKDKIQGGAGSLAGGIIPIGQGFFIQVTGNGPSITIPIDARVHSSQGYYKNVGDDEIKCVSVKVSKNQQNDEMNVWFNDRATEGFDDEFDARKMISLSSDAPTLYSFQADENLSIVGLPLLDENGRTVSISFEAGKNGTHLLETTIRNLDESGVILEDAYTGELVNLHSITMYQFESEVGTNDNRFYLHFNLVPTATEKTEEEGQIKIYGFDGQIYIKCEGESANETKEVWVYDLQGRELLQTALHPSTISSINVKGSGAQIVFVKVVSKNLVKTSKVFLKE